MTAVSVKVRVAGREPGLKRARKIVNNRKWFPKGKIDGKPTRRYVLYSLKRIRGWKTR